MLTLIGSSALAKEKKKKKEPAPTAVIVGTVFHGGGFALPGAQVVVAADPPAAGSGKGPWKAVCNSRGEFAVRVPPGPSSYNVVVRANGYQRQEKVVTFAADERLDVNFLLEAGGDSK